MFGIFNAVVAVAMGFGTTAVSGTPDDGVAVIRPAGFTVHFENTSTGYPVRASLTFATRSEAEAFARDKRQHGYTVRITDAR